MGSTPQVPHAARELWHRGGRAISLGCIQCPERPLCGGIDIDAPVFNCMDLCCGKPDSCSRCACPIRSNYSRLVGEVGTLELLPYRHNVRQVRSLPAYVPLILDRGLLRGPLPLQIVAVSLYDIVDAETGLARFPSREALLTHYRVVPTARLVITASGKDVDVERFWHLSRPKHTAQSLAALRPSLIATPNYSMYCDVPRHDNLINMKRIAIAFEVFASAGLPVALHVNGRTETDFVRWGEYIRASPHISTLTYEFATAGKSETRRDWHAEQLSRLARNVERPLSLLVRGGYSLLPRLASAFARVGFADTTALMKARHRRVGRNSRGRFAWREAHTLPGEPIDALLLRNVRSRRAAVSTALRLASRLPNCAVVETSPTGGVNDVH